MLKGREEVVQEALEAYGEPKERLAYIYGYLSAAYPGRIEDGFWKALRLRMAKEDKRVLTAFSRGVKDALYDIWDEIRLGKNEARVFQAHPEQSASA